ncbi:hypothetical protein GCM10011391_01180 [Pullulanibacillus camelliae]|uniref:Uncharacterized protein n=1 Tax=Pullulanibacillus camelliae TaxID=1707096 RepID=A0A8J2YB50_9BACL|nr:hypothetical protein [Pullulanibacillus camelliae]GGE26639.1 hypothetical protein GCM10011391_01180 [Pullulanibacillus camelliae]
MKKRMQKLSFIELEPNFTVSQFSPEQGFQHSGIQGDIFLKLEVPKDLNLKGADFLYMN